ncbi:nucleoside triphosphate pyrophosphohydrolase family protein [Herbaspirillum rhizosphaerae]|uniref:nucleoside triphosphate pyrophosphohydrolase family protein n=1 Tax=Herbaspirillum rhizosphaerae TaxID=346179 RepID=UPI0009F9F31F|nr:nucleoside triphosphate pyrophosphohydrolase family protein [Herbaspirillum rhizosphaerae]
MRKNVAKKKDDALTFAMYQAGVENTDETKKTTASLLGLVGEIGDLHSIFKRMLVQQGYPTFKQELIEEIGDVLWYVASLASRHDLSLQEIAEGNLTKAHQFFDSGGLTLFDKGFPDDERFPRKFSVVFEEKDVAEAIQVKIRINEIFIGDALTDNAHSDDGYRYHDVFHLAYAAVLGWSPVTRALLHRKRKSKPDIDEVEDGARAKIVEEAISIFIFNQANARGGFRNEKAIDIGLLKTVKKLCESLEVRTCTAKQWQRAIYSGFEMFHQLKENRGGIVHLDLDRQEVRYQKSL